MLFIVVVAVCDFLFSFLIASMWLRVKSIFPTYFALYLNDHLRR